ncbi:MAG: LysM peptidoglycan-binding domain-containing protein, partial [Anaerotignum sp.]|nr:LysM peptidoglycan-binding domain-containing protein [Anaerotignum sp.]
TYTVQKGDCLWNIAKKQLGDGTKYRQIAEKNGISDPNKIYPGQVLKL